MEAREKKLKFCGIEKTQVKSSCVRFYFVLLKLLKFVYWGSNKNIFFGVISYNVLHYITLEKCKKRMKYDLNYYSGTQGYCPLKIKITH